MAGQTATKATTAARKPAEGKSKPDSGRAPARRPDSTGSARISRREFDRRRKALMAMMPAASIAILPAAPERIRNRDVEFPYRQDSDFYYLSGFPEPRSVLVLRPGNPHGEAVLFCQDKEPELERWNGRIIGQTEAVDGYGFDDAFPIKDIDDILPGMLESASEVFYDYGANEAFDANVTRWLNRIRTQIREGARLPDSIKPLQYNLHHLRSYKSAEEIKVMREAGRISAEAHMAAMQLCKPGMYEYELEAIINYEFARQGAVSWAYPAIVGGGANACILHYRENNQKLKDGDLVLIDAGCELAYYAADITRTFPVNGRFTAEQKAVYDIVLEAQLQSIQQVMPGKHWNEPHEASVRVITQGLKDLKILKGSMDELLETKAYMRFFMHKTGHWLGMDVHDVGSYKIDRQWRQLEPGMVMTVEPGIYIDPDAEGVAKRWHGIGIRIEDDVCVSKAGPDVLTEKVPKRTEDIEQLMAS
ncbi:Xaa-Pro aminopeptidase [Allohahella sp. A8]|uniref:Xaa-Pro aminopeptidase n=1 Tax=Allohahella sp. A8 TaxID=3141461 RepID=UPI002687E73C